MKEKYIIWNLYKLYFLRFYKIPSIKRVIFKGLIITLSIQHSYAQDNPALEFHFSPIQFVTSPDLNGSRVNNFGGSLFYNLNRNFSVGANYNYTRINDLYTIGTVIINENNNNDLLLIDEITSNLQLRNHFINTAIKYRTFSIKKAQFYASLLLGVSLLQPKILPFDQDTYMQRKDYQNLIANAKQGVNLDLFNIDNPLDPEFIEPTKYLDRQNQFIIGLEFGVLVKLNEILALDIGIALNDLFKSIEYYNTRTIGMISELEDNQNFLQDGTATYLGQSTTLQNRLFLNFKIGLVFSFIQKKR